MPMAPRQIAPISSRNVIYAAIVGNLLVAATKFTAAAVTGGSAMLSEGVHSVVDTGNSILLLYGMDRASRPPDDSHPLGYGREIYFWSFIVAVLVFALGAGVSFYEGISHILDPQPIQFPIINYAVFAASAVFDGTSWLIALWSFKDDKRYRDIPRAIHDSKDPPSFINLFEDSAALIGLLIAVCGTYLSVRYSLPWLDGLASIMIGLVLATAALFLAIETKGLLIGEPADPAIVESIRNIAMQIDGVANANGILTVHLAPKQVVVALSLEFQDDLTTTDIEQKVTELEHRLRTAYPIVTAVFIKPQSAGGFRDMLAKRRGKYLATTGQNKVDLTKESLAI
jgi:cation diffusion facilitator family transporter